MDALSHLQLRQPLSLELERQLEPLDDIERFEELQLLAEVQVRRIAGGIGQRAGIGNGPHERADPSIVAAQLENLVDDRAVLAFQLTREVARRRLIRTGFVVDTKHAVLVGRRAAESCPMEAGQRHGDATAGEPHPLGYLRDDPDLRVGVVLPGHQEHAIVAAYVDRQGNRHARKDHRVVQGNDS